MINSVTGPRDFTGMILPHEHLSIDYGQMHGTDVPLTDQQHQQITDILHRAAAHGVAMIVDCTPPGYGRNIPAFQDYSRATGVTIVASTGTFCEQWADLPDFVYSSAVEELSELFISELQRDCGVIKVATSAEWMRDVERRALEAAALAHKETGAPIVGHTTGSLGPDQVRFYLEHGVDPGKVLISHVCAADEPIEYAIEIARMGAYVGLDRIGHAAHADAHWLAVLRGLHAADLLDRALISHDSVQFFRGPDAIAGHTFTDLLHIPMTFRDALMGDPVLADSYALLTQANPARWLGLTGAPHAN